MTAQFRIGPRPLEQRCHPETIRIRSCFPGKLCHHSIAGAFFYSQSLRAAAKEFFQTCISPSRAEDSACQNPGSMQKRSGFYSLCLKMLMRKYGKLSTRSHVQLPYLFLHSYGTKKTGLIISKGHSHRNSLIASHCFHLIRRIRKDSRIHFCQTNLILTKATLLCIIKTYTGCIRCMYQRLFPARQLHSEII